MDRLVKADVKELNLVFSRNQKCSTTFKLTNLMHTMAVAVSFSTTNPSLFSFTHPFSIIPPLGTASFTLFLSKPSDNPPLATPPENVLVRSSMLPTGKANPEDLRRLFAKPGPHIFKDITIPISFVGPHVIESLLSSPSSKTLEIAFVLSKAVLWCDGSHLGSLLRLAVATGNCYVASVLVDAGADVNRRDPDGESVMSSAVKSGNVEMVRFLIESGFVINHLNDRFLHSAASINRVDIMEVLCMGYLDIDIDSVDSEGRTPLHIGGIYGFIEVLEFLITLGSDPDKSDSKRWTPLHYASSEGHLSAVEFLLNSCNYVKYAVTKDGKTAFDLAVENGHTAFYDLLQLGDDLHRSARKGDIDEMRKCLAEGANVNGRDQNGWTPLHKSSFKGWIDGVKILLSHGARVDLVDGTGFTPLHRAVESGHAQVAMLLIAHGAKASMKSLAVPLDLLCHKIERA